MLLNPKASSFYFVFPRGFFPEKVIDKYLPYLKKQPIPYDTLDNYINSSIQSITMPSVTIDSVEQVRNLGKKIYYKGATPVQDLFSHELTIGFKNSDAYLNYFIMLDTILHFLNFKNQELFIQDLPVRIMDNEGNIVFSVEFKEVTLTSFSEVELNYSNNNPAYSAFTMGIRYNYIDILLEAK
jgi:hypothetical protein